MGLEHDLEGRHVHCRSEWADVPFVARTEDGSTFMINSVKVLGHSTIIKQIRNEGGTEIKFCVREREGIPEIDGVYDCEVVFFPMYRGLGNKKQEVAHATVVEHSDSFVNGNLVVRGTTVTEGSSNHWLLGFEDIVNPVVTYAEEYVQSILDSRG